MTTTEAPEPIRVSDVPEPEYDVEIVEDLADGHVVYVARHPELPGCMSHGSTPEEAAESLDDARAIYLAALDKAGVARPRPRKVAGRVTLLSLTHSTASAAPAGMGPAVAVWRVVPTA